MNALALCEAVAIGVGVDLPAMWEEFDAKFDADLGICVGGFIDDRPNGDGKEWPDLNRPKGGA